MRIGTSLEKEVWKPIKGFRDMYEVSDHGRVRSLDRLVENKRWGKSRMKGKILSSKRRTGHPGYMNTALYTKSGVRSDRPVHRLVAESFIPKVKGKKIVNHIDHNPQNNHSSNLEWCTPKENIQKSFKFGRRKVIRGPEHHNSKLSERDIKAIRLLSHQLGFGTGPLSQMFGVTRTTVSKYIK